MKILKLIFIGVGMFFIVWSMNPPGAQASVINFLDDYDLTGDVSDVVHLGDQYISSFIQKPAGGGMYAVNFDLPAPPSSGDNFSLYIQHYQTDPNSGYYDHVYINGVDLGYLSSSTSIRWISQIFSGGVDWLHPTGNTLAITAGQVGGNLDDFEFTSLYLTYESAAVPVPAAVWLLGSGLLGLIGLRRKNKD